jgi:hypothetical protein
MKIELTLLTFTSDGIKYGVIKHFKLKNQHLTELMLEDYYYNQENLYLQFLSDYYLNKMIQLLETNS